jgi:O-antigen/teichoic acid export membrane protein
VGTRAIAGSVRIGILLGIARAYGPAKFGQLSLVISMVEILRTFSEFGVDTISIRRFAQTPPEERAELLGGIIGAKLLMASCFYCIGAAVLLTITREPVELELGAITGLSLFFSGALGGITSYLLSFFSISRVFRTTLLTSVLSGCFVLIAILSKASLLWVIVGLPLADALNLLLLSQKLDTHLRVRFRVRETISLLKESLPVGIAVTSVILYFRLDNLFLFKFAGAAALGLYAVCYRIVEPALLIPNSFSTTSYTLLSRTEYQHAGARRLMRILIRTMCPAYAFTATAAAFFLLLGKPLVTRFFPGYPAAYPVLLVLVLTLSVRTVNATLVAVLNSRAKYSLLAKITVINLAVNLLLVIALVPKWGPLGAAWAALLTEVLNGLMQGKNVISILLPTNCPPLAQSIGVE